MSGQTNHISKEDFLERTEGGFSFLAHIYRKEYGIELKRDHSGLKRPWGIDKNPSVCIRSKDGKYLFKDFGEERYQGDVFNFAGFYYGLAPAMEFTKLLNYMYEELGITKPQNKIKQKGQMDKRTGTFSFSLSGIKIKEEFDFFDKEYWNKYRCSETILADLGLFAVESYEAGDKNRITIQSKPGNPIYGYKVSDECYKIYRPYDKQYKWSWIGSKPDDFPNIYGLETLLPLSDYLLVVEGLKDYLTAKAHGYNVVALDNVYTKLSNVLLDELKTDNPRIILCLDNDTEGIKRMKGINEQKNIEYIILPDTHELSDGSIIEIGKDISDLLSFSKDHPILERNLNEEIKAKIIEINNQKEKEKQRIDTPHIPETVYKNLPARLSSIVDKIEDRRQKDILYISLLNVLSSCLPNCSFNYGEKKYQANLMPMIIAPPASGKGILSIAKEIGMEIHNHKLSRTISNRKVHRDMNDTKATHDLARPPQLMHFIPANNSSSGMLKNIFDNRGRGMICESEADSVYNSFEKDWGNYDDILRKAYEHETITSSRRTDEFYIEIPEPCLSILLTCTDDQFMKLIKSPSNGLFSRFMYYIFDQRASWQNKYTNRIHNTNMINELKKDMFDLYSELIRKKITFKFKDEQMDIIQFKFDSLLEKSLELSGDIAASSVFRMAVNFNRIAMLLTIVNMKFKDESYSDVIYCDDKMFNIALETTDTLIEHSLLLLDQFPVSRKVKLKSNKTLFYEELPEYFYRSEIKNLINKFDINIRTLSRFLSNTKLFERIKHGYYRKLNI